jgi:hypothetical protein
MSQIFTHKCFVSEKKVMRKDKEKVISDDWYEVEVFGKGKVGTRNESYLNLRYSDGSEAGVFIDKHEC